MEIVRFAYFTDRTLGRLHFENLAFWTIERPWLGNQREISCIPCGDYPLVRVNSPRFGADMWEIGDVPDRSHILIHVANTAGDIMGCVGLGVGLYGNLAGVANSRKAITEFYALTQAASSLDITVRDGVIRQ